jgi:hypothetical protein
MKAFTKRDDNIEEIFFEQKRAFSLLLFWAVFAITVTAQGGSEGVRWPLGV